MVTYFIIFAAQPKSRFSTPRIDTPLVRLSRSENPVAIGSKGSAWVGGEGVTRGYIHLPELTASRYKLDKFRNDG
jgi:non-ribosomal peptide synthetase component F